jgi:polyisoprenoid-binding protein YceI/protein-tyrosine-phosphatase
LTDPKPTVLFVCVHNAGRSQMAAGLLSQLAGDRVEVRSAGSEPADQLNPVVVEAMGEKDIDLSRERPKLLDAQAVEEADAVITMGCGDACPIFPGKRYEEWELEDPAGKDLETVRRVRDEIEKRVRNLLDGIRSSGRRSQPGWRSAMSQRTTSLIRPGTWTVDPAHSTVGFAVKHMGIANVRGRFTEFEGALEVGEDLASSSARGVVKVASITTEEVQRDEHLRSADFFNVEEFPEITFESTRVEAIDDESTSVLGDLTMHGITHEVKLKVLVQGSDVDPWGKERAGVEVVGVLMRSDFDMKFNQALGSGNVLVGDRVNMSLDISAVRQE